MQATAAGCTGPAITLLHAPRWKRESRCTVLSFSGPLQHCQLTVLSVPRERCQLSLVRWYYTCQQRQPCPPCQDNQSTRPYPPQLQLPAKQNKEGCAHDKSNQNFGGVNLSSVQAASHRIPNIKPFPSIPRYHQIQRASQEHFLILSGFDRVIRPS